MSRGASVADSLAGMSIVPAKGEGGAPRDSEKGVRAARAPRPKAPKKPAPAPAAPARKFPWDGRDHPVQMNNAVPERVKMKLTYMKLLKAYKGSAADFVAQAVEEKIDAVVAQYIKDGGTL